MEKKVEQRVWLDRQADQIERALTGMALPVRVNGGQVREGRVRYHLTPVGGTRLEAVAGRQGEVARALGAAEVHVARETGGISLEIPAAIDPELRLLPLMHAMGDLPPRTIVIGMTTEGRPLTLSLDEPATQHLIVRGSEGSGRSELLRTLLFSLTLTSRPAQLQVLAVDLSGRELACLEALPHSLTDLAADADFALELMEWVADEAERRAAGGGKEPHLVLLVDDFDRLPEAKRSQADAALKRSLRAGEGTGVHLAVTLDAAARLELSLLRSTEPGVAMARAEATPGHFSFRAAADRVEATVAWLPVRDLARVVALARERPGMLERPRLQARLE